MRFHFLLAVVFFFVPRNGISLPELFEWAFDGDGVSVIGSLCIADALG